MNRYVIFYTIVFIAQWIAIDSQAAEYKRWKQNNEDFLKCMKASTRRFKGHDNANDVESDVKNCFNTLKKERKQILDDAKLTAD